ncbi:hypothetical protein [Microcoleus sp. F4-D5]|uniref:hypothetical protein n=1 Tax=Microcoleus sp. F4-D5 TaxID=2818760 RepID=UPI002FD21CE0
MKPQISELINSAKQLGDFSDAEKQEIFLTIKEAKARGLLRKQPDDRCLNKYINLANYLLRTQSAEEFTSALNQNLECLYVYVALVGLNCITTTA